MARILIVDDEAHVRRLLAMILVEASYEVLEAGSVREARALFSRHQFHLVITDQRMPDGDGLALLAFCREADATMPVIFISAYATVELAVAAMRQGAFDVLSKPFQAEAVRISVARACERADLMRENERLRGAVRQSGSTRKLVGRSAAMRHLIEVIPRISSTSVTVLITGETGTGKELVARAIHEASARVAKPFIAVNCAGFTDTLLESELFGHERGAFTGADKPRQGLFEAAHGGTLFLDEAGEMSQALQAKLLRVLIDGELLRVGSSTPRKVDVRVVVATHRDLQQLVRAGLFREDLYYRIAVFPISVPPLRARGEDLELLAEGLLAELCRDLKLPPHALSDAALETLRGYAFPGNVRELRNLLERALILSTGLLIGPSELPVQLRGVAQEECEMRPSPEKGSLKTRLERMERELLLRALKEAGGVQAEAARQLGISKSDMTYKLRKHNLDISQAAHGSEPCQTASLARSRSSNDASSSRSTS
jgi:DNA-binding NtrC family response regulator